MSETHHRSMSGFGPSAMNLLTVIAVVEGVTDIALILLVYATVSLGLSGIGLWPAVAVHLGMTVWCVKCLSRIVSA